MTIERSVCQIFPHLVMPSTFWKTVSKVGQTLLRLCKLTTGSEELDYRIWCHRFQTLSLLQNPSLSDSVVLPLRVTNASPHNRGGSIFKTCLAFNLSERTTPNISLVLINQSSTISHFKILWRCRHTPRTLSEYWTQSLLYWLCELGLCSWIKRTLPSFIQQQFIERVDNVEADVKWKMRQNLPVLAEKYRWFQNTVCYEENKTNLGSFLLKKALRNVPLKPLKERRSQKGSEPRALTLWGHKATQWGRAGKRSVSSRSGWVET